MDEYTDIKIYTLMQVCISNFDNRVITFSQMVSELITLFDILPTPTSAQIQSFHDGWDVLEVADAVALDRKIQWDALESKVLVEKALHTLKQFIEESINAGGPHSSSSGLGEQSEPAVPEPTGP